MKVLGISADEQKALWLILGAIYHLGAAGATKGVCVCDRYIYTEIYIIRFRPALIFMCIFKHVIKLIHTNKLTGPVLQ